MSPLDRSVSLSLFFSAIPNEVFGFANWILNKFPSIEYTMEMLNKKKRMRKSSFANCWCPSFQFTSNKFDIRWNISFYSSGPKCVPKFVTIALSPYFSHSLALEEFSFLSLAEMKILLKSLHYSPFYTANGNIFFLLAFTTRKLLPFEWFLLKVPSNRTINFGDSLKAKDSLDEQMN